MTQQQFYPPQQGFQPPQAPQPVYPQQVQQPYAPQFPGYPPQGYGQPMQPPVQQQVPQAPVVPGTIADFYAQPSTGGGPSVSWKNKPEGTFVAGTVSTKPSVMQDSDPKTGQLKFFKDGRPKFVMCVPLQVQPSPEYPEGECRLYVRGQMRDELVRAMAEAGCPEGTEPGAGDGIQVVLVHRKPTQSGIPQNIFAIRYAKGTGAPSPAPVPQAQPVQQYQQQPAAPQAPAYAQQMPQAPQPMAQPVQQQAPWPTEQQVQAPAAYAAQPVQQSAPAPQFQAPAAQPQAAQQPAIPDGLSADQAQLLARLTGGQG